MQVLQHSPTCPRTGATGPGRGNPPSPGGACLTPPRRARAVPTSSPPLTPGHASLLPPPTAYTSSESSTRSGSGSPFRGFGKPTARGVVKPKAVAPKPSSASAPHAGVHDSAVLRDAATSVRVHVVVPRCHTVPGEHLVLVGDCEALGNWDVANALPLAWCSGHMHSGTFALPADWETIKAKLVLVRGRGQDAEAVWEPGFDRSVILQAPKDDLAAFAGAAGPATAQAGPKAGPASAMMGGGAARSVRPGVSHDYVVVAHWGHTDATAVLAREVPSELLAMESQLSAALTELRTARTAAAASQEKLSRMAADLASSERAARQSAEQLQELQSKHSAMAEQLTEAKREAKAAAAEAAAAAVAAAAAAQASSASAADVEARVSSRYESRMAELRQELEGVKGQYSGEVASLQQALEASQAKEAEAQALVGQLREIVQRDVGKLRAELSQLVNEYISARQQLADQAAQIEASEKLRIQQIDGLSSEIKNLITKYNSAQTTIAEQQRLLEELQAARGSLPARALDPLAQVAAPPSPDPQAGRDWRSDWARLRKMQAAAANGNGNGNGVVMSHVR